MQTLTDVYRCAPPVSYWGERDHWLVAAAVHRDSDALDRSNFEVLQKRLESVPDLPHSESPHVERFGHPGVGWVDYLVVDPEHKAQVEVAEKARADLDQYPVLDEQHYSALEQEEHEDNCVRYGYLSGDCSCCEGEKLDHDWHIRNGKDDDCRICRGEVDAA